MRAVESHASDDLQHHTTARAFRHVFEGPFFRRLMLRGIQSIPPSIQRATMPLWAVLFYLLLPQARRAVLCNLDVIAGPKTGLHRHLRGVTLFVHYAQMISDTYRCYLGAPLHMEVTSLGRTEEVLKLLCERGGILATGHIGMWQVGPLLHGWDDLPPFFLARAEEPTPHIQKWEEQFRQKIRTIYTSASPFSALSLVRVLRDRCVVGMQIDRVPSGHSVPVQICGRTAHFPEGPALLARLTQAPLLPSFFVIDESKGQRTLLHHVGSPIFVAETSDRRKDIAEATQRLATEYEKLIRRFPTQFYQFFEFFGPVTSQATPV